MNMSDAYNVKYNGPTTSLIQAIVKRFKEKYVPKWKVSEMRECLRKLASNKPDAHNLYQRMQNEALIKERHFQFSKLSNEDIVNNWMDREEYEEINDHLAFTLAEQIFVREDSDIVDIPSSAKAAGIKLNGRDALALLFEGGGEMLIRMLSVHRHECLLQNHEACDKLIQQLTHNETFFNTKAEEKHMLLN